jgi:putative NIF3 family GTP cyclohydrolase 1 type 2
MERPTARMKSSMRVMKTSVYVKKWLVARINIIAYVGGSGQGGMCRFAAQDKEKAVESGD